MPQHLQFHIVVPQHCHTRLDGEGNACCNDHVGGQNIRTARYCPGGIGDDDAACVGEQVYTRRRGQTWRAGGRISDFRLLILAEQKHSSQSRVFHQWNMQGGIRRQFNVVGIRALNQCEGGRVSSEARRGDGDNIFTRLQAGERIHAISPRAPICYLQCAVQHSHICADDNGDAAVDAHYAGKIRRGARCEGKRERRLRPDDKARAAVSLIAHALYLEGVFPYPYALEAELTCQICPGCHSLVEADARAGQPPSIVILRYTRQRSNAQHRDSFQRQLPIGDGISAGVGKPGGRRNRVAGVIDTFFSFRAQGS